jgi:cyclic pyranopterin phosphate synthase
LTGGEPTLRRDFLAIAQDLSAMEGLEQLALTTNGFRLARRVESYLEAGINRLNISIDSLNAETFQQMTGKDHLGEILAGVDQALELPFQAVKVNAVLTKSSVVEELPAFLEWLQSRPLTLRFIEMMPTDLSQRFREAAFAPAGRLKSYLAEHGWQLEARQETAGPAQVYTHPDYAGRIGVIAPYETGFCNTCNRVRVNAFGGIRSCLWGEDHLSLVPWLQTDDQQDELVGKLQEVLRLKPERHGLHEGDYRFNASLSQIGG